MFRNDSLFELAGKTIFIVQARTASFGSVQQLDYHLLMFWHRLLQTLKLLILAIAVTVILAPEWPAFGDEAHQLDAIVGQRKFDFLVWELESLGVKAKAMLANGHSFQDERSRHDAVINYLGLVSEIAQINRQIDSAFIDPDVTDPAAATSSLQELLVSKRDELLQVQPLAEAIVQDQVADLLVEDSFDFLNTAWPPVMMHMTPLPAILIVSPRDHIERIYAIPLVHGLTTADEELMESRIFDELNLSALVVPIGGLGMYPSMIIETTSINRLAEVTAHEWAHHWMAPYPINLLYSSDGRVRVMNETVASIVGSEVGPRVIDRYYPEYRPQPSSPPTATAEMTADSFDFRAEMAETRTQADKLLAEGKVEAAEAYMEIRRQYFVTNRYNIRKLNQAYFAFYGAYADEPGATGGDPIGPMLLDIRASSPSLRAFMKRVAPIGSLPELESIWEETRTE